MYYVYILYSEKSDRYYIGYTERLHERIKEHNDRKSSHFTSKFKPWKMVYFEIYVDKSMATKREKYIKKMKSR